MRAPPSAQTSLYLLPQSVIPRGLAYIIDSAVVAVVTAVLMATGVLEGGAIDSLDPDTVREMLQSNSGLALYVILFSYFLICEGVTGRTVGKVVLGLRVVRVADGASCGWARSIVRNLVRPLDMFFAGLPGALVVILSPARQRIGDLLGGTLVVRQVNLPPAMAAVIPGMLRRCESCGRLAPAAGPCPGCSTPAPAAPAPAEAPFGAAVMQPLAGMMAAGEAAAALRNAAQDVLAAESAFGAASAAESARIERESQGQEGEGSDDGGHVEEGAGEAAADADGAPEVATDTGRDDFVAADGAHGLSDEYVSAWRDLMGAVETLRARRTDLDTALGKARVTVEQVTAADAVLRRLLEQVAPYMDADDDEAVLAAFMARAAGAGAQPADESGAAAQDPAS